MTLDEIYHAPEKMPDYSDADLEAFKQQVLNTIAREFPLSSNYTLVVTRGGHHVLFRGADLVGWVKLQQKEVLGRTYQAVVMIYILPEFRLSRALSRLLTAVRHEVQAPVLVDVGLYPDGAQLLLGLIKRGKVHASVLHPDGALTPIDDELPRDDHTAIVLERVSAPWYDYSILDTAPHNMVIDLFEEDASFTATTYRFQKDQT